MGIPISNISWDEFNHQLKEVFGKRMRLVDDLSFNVIMRLDVGGEFVKLNDMESLDCLQYMRKMDGELCVITDYCYKKKCGPFLVDASEINNFVKDFHAEYGEVFCSTDVIVISFTDKLIWVLFHEGIYWLSKGNYPFSTTPRRSIPP
jgi:hypothetical protein